MPETGDLLRNSLVVLAILILAAKIGGELLGRLGQPYVLGELLAGLLLGNLGLFEPLRTNPILDLAAQIGAVLLLFEVGLESDLSQLLAVGGSAVVVSCLGVAAPMLLGFGVSALLLPEAGWITHLFVGGTLGATSVGITARVLKDLRKGATKEGRIILGAAVVDDVIGLIVLAVITGLVRASNGDGASVSGLAVLWMILKAVLFVVAAVVVGRFLTQRVFRHAAKLRSPGILLGLCVSFCFALAALAGYAGLAPIIGGFAAGVALEEAHYKPFLERGESGARELLYPVNTLMVPLFFLLMGMRVDLRSFAQPGVLTFAALITVAAIVGKQLCGLGILERGVDRLAVGIGMIPRGEVELIFASLGTTLMLEGHPILQHSQFSAIVLMVMLTTFLTPPLLKLAFARKRHSSA
ncbi:MAG TPA: cation:proton antiporter [Bryobacteraceae bacterium]|jgi:Kef-type K+ transport system membrane component KefB